MKENPRRARVLIVEDEEANTELLRRTLRSDARLLLASSVEEAQAILETTAVDVVVTDHRLPDASGTSLLRNLAQSHPTVGRILLTAYGDSEEVIQACDSGIVERFFLKPHSSKSLRIAVLELLRQRKIGGIARILLADDDVLIRQMIRELLETRHFDVTEATDGQQALREFSKGSFDVALIDVLMPRLDGAGVLKSLLAQDPDLPVILVTATDPVVSLNLLEAGAYDLISKPIRTKELLMRVERAVLARRLAIENKRLLDELEASRHGDEVVAESEGMKSVLGRAGSVARHDVNVLITGETGTGKEVVARLVHAQSPRREGPFIPVNCGAIPESLIESELFGHERGAFTGAHATKKGFFESAQGGTIFLDEVGDLPLQSQVRLLRVIEAKQVQRVGATSPINLDVRIIAATHRNLQQRVSESEFREDLYYRLTGFTIEIPPLRQRQADIPPLMRMAAANFCLRNGLPLPEMTPRALAQAQSHPWPGNVRELLHVIERALITHGPELVDELDVSQGVRSHGTTRDVTEIDDSLPLHEAVGPLIEDVERRYFLRVLSRYQGHLGQTARHAGIHRKSLYNKLKRLNISVADAQRRRGPPG